MVIAVLVTAVVSNTLLLLTEEVQPMVIRKHYLVMLGKKLANADMELIADLCMIDTEEGVEKGVGAGVEVLMMGEEETFVLNGKTMGNADMAIVANMLIILQLERPYQNNGINKKKCIECGIITHDMVTTIPKNTIPSEAKRPSSVLKSLTKCPH